MRFRLRNGPTRAGRAIQRGFGLIAILFLLGALALLGLSVLLDKDALILKRQANTPPALALAASALLGEAASGGGSTAGFLPLPDVGPDGGTEGNAASNFAGNGVRRAVVGRLPWKTLGLGDLRDGAGECLWYAVAGRFKNQPTPPPILNWDAWTHDGYDGASGKLRLVDETGNLLGEYAALILAAGAILPGQTRTASGTAPICGGHYDAIDYLDPRTAASAPGHNYLAGTNHRVATSDADQNFILATSRTDINDRVLGVDAQEVFDLSLKAYLKTLMEESQFATIAIAGPKGLGNLNCSSTSQRYFCESWRDHLLLTALSPAAMVTIDGAPVGPCSRVLLFGGQAAAGQVRATAPDRDNPANYLEGSNLANFAVPIASGAGFSGTSVYDRSNRSQDVLRCIP